LIEPRANIKSIRPYQLPKVKIKVRLSSNENPYPLPSEIIAEFLAEAEKLALNRYPDPEVYELRSEIGSSFGFSGENILLGNGSNELIMALFLAYGGPDRNYLHLPPTYGIYKLVAQITNTRISEVYRSVEDFSLTPILGEILTAQTNLLFICNPNNPTGNLTNVSLVEKIARETDSLIVVDEAYGEFGQKSAISLVREYPNIVVLKTFSKAFSLAGLRIGFLIASSPIIKTLEKVKLPYNVNALSQCMACLVWRNQARLKSSVELIVKERERLYKALKELDGLKVYPSEANFILFKVKGKGQTVWEKLVERGILIRNFSSTPALKDCLRVTIGTPEENNFFLANFREILKEEIYGKNSYD
jgi:histidinol-phosphate aminotransferase